jgi:two-component system chemotaxis sensor kinase CheA
LLPRLRKLATSLENQTGKRIDFNTDIDQLEVDEQLLKGLRSCLVHLMRNAIDHGITSSESGTTDGMLELKMEASGDTLIVEFSDNGKGLNLDKVGEKAIQNGKADSSELTDMNDSQISALIFESGLSTKQEASPISGRGVGLDSVKETVSKFDGDIFVESAPGAGTRFTMKFPFDTGHLNTSSDT